MRAVIEFLKTTLLGGLLVLMPAYVAVLLLLRAAQGVVALLGPITSGLSVSHRTLVALAIVLAASFFTGLAIRTRLGRRVSELVEHRVLDRIPGYGLMRAVSRRLGGQDDETGMFAVALVELEEALVPAFIVDEHADGRCTVFVPSVPTPAAGALYILTPERVHRVDVPLPTALGCITRWGAGTNVLLEAMQKAEGAKTPARA